MLTAFVTLARVSNTEISEAVTRLAGLSESRAQRVLSLIHDLAELEALENAADLAAARDALSEMEEPLSWDAVKTRLDAQFDSPQPIEREKQSGFDFERVRHLIGSVASDSSPGRKSSRRPFR